MTKIINRKLNSLNPYFYMEKILQMGKKYYKRKKKKKKLKTDSVPRKCKESLNNGFILVADFFYNGRTKIRRMGNFFLMNSSYYQENTSLLIFTEEKSILYISQRLSFKQWNCTKAKPPGILQNLPCIHCKNKTPRTYCIYTFSMQLCKVTWRFTYGLLWLWSSEKSALIEQSHHDWWTLEEKGKAMPSNFYICKKNSIMESPMQTYNTGTRLSNQTKIYPLHFKH